MPQQRVYIWDRVVRIAHWSLASLFALNYFLLDPGGDIHEWLGYLAVVIVLTRCWHGLRARGYANFSHVNFSVKAYQTHIAHLRQRSIPVNEGHNPFGWLMVFFMFFLFLLLGASGFLLEETDYFFGSDEMELVHKVAADALFICVCLHVAAVIAVSFFGRVSLLPAMLTGYRNGKPRGR